MKVSIITPSFNSASTIADTLQSVAGQSYGDIEHIIIDGESSDGTVGILKKCDSQSVNWISEPDKGIYDAMNKGIEIATGDVIGILNSDDVYFDSEVIDMVMSCFKEDPNLDSVYGDLFYVAKNDINKFIRYWRTGNIKPFKKGWHPPHPTFFVKKEIYSKYGLFSLKYNLAADFEIMLRFLEKYKITSLYLNRVLVKMRRGGATNNSFSGFI